MRRTLLLILLLPALALAILLAAFAASEMNVRGQSFAASLGDFIFLNNGAMREALDLGVPPYREADAEAVLAHLRPTTHHFVTTQAVWWLSAWGEAAVPHLAAELERRDQPDRREGAIRALGMIGGEEAAAVLAAVLIKALTASDPQRRQDMRHFRDLVTALGQIPLPMASRALIAAYRRQPEQSFILAEIGRTGTPEALAFLLQMADRGPQAASDDLIWGLAMSRQPLAAERLVAWLDQPDAERARLCRDALDQFMRAEALTPLLDALAAADNDVGRATLLDLLDGSWAASDRSVALIAPLLADPWLAPAAQDALARSGSRDAWLAIWRHLPADRAWLYDDGLFHVAYRFGEVALPEIGAQLRSPEAKVRLQTLQMLPRLYIPEARQLVEPMLHDGNAEVAAAAQDALLELDKVALFRSFTEALPSKFGRLTWENFRPDWLFMDFTYEEGFESVWSLFAWLHLAGLLLSLLLGWALLIDALRIFEPYRFNLFILFLLAEGFVGDLLFCNHWPLPAAKGYLLATATHLLLLIGYLAHRREVVPGELRGRMERLGGASLWLLLPLLLLGTPIYGEALRLFLRDWNGFFLLCLLLTLLAALVLEQALLPRSHGNGRLTLRYGGERLLAFALCTMLLGVLLAAGGKWAMARMAAGDGDASLLALLLFAPLPWFLLLFLLALRPREWFAASGSAQAPNLPPPPGERLRPIERGAQITLHLRPQRRRGSRLLRALLRLTFILAAAGGAALLAGESGDIEAMVLAVFAGILGAALAGLLLQGLAPTTVIQLRAGHIRFGRARFGGVFGGSAWLSRLTMSRSLRQSTHANRVESARVEEEQPFDAAEEQWLRQAMRWQAGGAAPMARVDPAAATLLVRPTSTPSDPEAGLPIEIALRNHGQQPLSYSALDLAARGKLVAARVDGAPAFLHLSRSMREQPVPPGGERLLKGRLFPSKLNGLTQSALVELVGEQVQCTPYRAPLQPAGH